MKRISRSSLTTLLCLWDQRINVLSGENMSWIFESVVSLKQSIMQKTDASRKNPFPFLFRFNLSCLKKHHKTSQCKQRKYNYHKNKHVEVTTSSDDPSYFLLVWNVATILQHFLFCKWQGIQECLHRRFPIAIFPAVRT